MSKDLYSIIRKDSKNFVRFSGISTGLFDDLLAKLKEKEIEYLAKNPLSSSGKKGDMNLSNQLLLTLLYLRHYDTYFNPCPTIGYQRKLRQQTIS